MSDQNRKITFSSSRSCIPITTSTVITHQQPKCSFFTAPPFCYSHITHFINPRSVISVCTTGSCLLSSGTHISFWHILYILYMHHMVGQYILYICGGSYHTRVYLRLWLLLFFSLATEIEIYCNDAGLHFYVYTAHSCSGGQLIYRNVHIKSILCIFMASYEKSFFLKVGTLRGKYCN